MIVLLAVSLLFLARSARFDVILDGICIPFQYIADFIVSLRREWLGCWRQLVYQLITLSCRDARMIIFIFT